MPDPTDLVRAWEELGQQLARIALPPGSPEFPILAPMREQAELYMKTLRQQAEFQKDVGGQLFAPVKALLDALGQASTMMRTQAEAFAAMGEAMRNASGMLGTQADLIDQHLAAVRAPIDAIKSFGGQQPQ